MALYLRPSRTVVELKG